MAGQYSPQELQYFDRLFNLVDQDKASSPSQRSDLGRSASHLPAFCATQVGILTGDLSIAFLIKSKLPQRTLGEIWALSDPNNTGYLAKDGWYKCCRLIGWCQAGEAVKEELVTRTGPIPRFEGVPPPPPTPVPQSTLSPQTTGARSFSPAPSASGLNPLLTPAERSQYTRVFAGSGPEGGLLTGQKAQGIFMKSGLGVDQLAAIWNLADTQQRGSLDLPDFIIGMYYIQACMSGSISTLPATLPAGLYEAASGGRGRPPPPPPPSVNPMARQITGPTAAPGLHGSPVGIPRQLAGQAGYQGGILQPQLTGQSFNSQQAPPQRQFSSPPTSSIALAFPTSFGSVSNADSQIQQVPWDITPQDKKTSDGFFDGMDTAKRGYLEGDAVVPFMMQSGLESSILAQVWDLADIRKEGKLSKEEFAVAMHLINGKLGGRDLPSTLPIGMTPPNLRGKSQQDSAAPESAKDLFDVFGESPPIQAPVQQPQQSYFSASSAPQPQPPSRALSPATAGRQQSAEDPFGMPSFSAAAPAAEMGDLMGDDEDDEGPEEAVSKPSAPAPKAPVRFKDSSIEIGNANNSIESTNKAIGSLKAEREVLEERDSAGSAQLREIEMRLSSVRAQHENETRTVKDLRSRVAEQKTKLEQNRKELIKNESELSALRAEKDEIEQTLLRDKEEVRTMGKRMKEVTEETIKLKAVLETMKKEARQQKGMVAISKKQVANLEGGKDTLQKEMDDFAANQHSDPEDFATAVEARTQSPFAPTSRTLATAQSIPLPVTPQRALSPNPTGSKSNNPFERMGFAVKSPLAAHPTEETPGSDRGIIGGMSNVQTVTLGVGAALTAGALAVGGLAAGAVTGATTAVTTGLEAIVGKSDILEGEHEANDAAQASPTSISSKEDEQDAGGTSQTENVSGPDHAADPFGLGDDSNESAKGPGLVSGASSKPPANDDPFGMPSFIPGADNTQKFDGTFGDDFAASSTTFAPTSSKELTESLHLAPSSEATRGFDDEFEDFDAPAPAPVVASAIPGSLLKPNAPERSLSTQALAPESVVHTPTGEFPSGSTPVSFEEERPVPVNVSALSPKEDISRLQPLDYTESSDDEMHTPEEAERGVSPFTGGRPEQSISQGASETLGRPSESVSHIQQKAPADDFDSEEDSFQQTPAPRPVQAFELFPSGVASPPPNATSPFGALSPSASETRRAPPPPPSQPRIVSTSNNPFGSYGAEPTSASPASYEAPAQSHSAIPIAPPIAQSLPAARTGTGTGNTSNFDDDDFDFEDLPAAQVATSASKPANGASTTTRSDFDDEFDDFSTDFEMVSNPSSNVTGGGQRGVGSSAPGSGLPALGGALPPPPQTSLPQGKVVQDAPQLQGFDEMFGGGNFGGSTVLTSPTGNASSPFHEQRQPSQQASYQQQQGPSTFSFDDAFGDVNNSAPPTHTNDSRGYAAPSGPPPPPSSVSAGRSGPPALPNRQPSTSGIATAAQPDDLNDVKKLCNMGFDRELVIAALEANDYSFDKTLNALLPGA